MNWVEKIFIIAGISLDIFAAMEVQGAMLSEVKKKSLAIACCIVVALQLGFFSAGYFVCRYIDAKNIVGNAEFVGDVIAVAIFALLGIRLLIKAIKREFVHESHRELTVAGYIRIIFVTTIYTIAAGCACGFVSANVVALLVIIIICSIGVVVSGLYTGLHFGFQSKTGIYTAGAILLWVAGVMMFVRNLYPLFA